MPTANFPRVFLAFLALGMCRNMQVLGVGAKVTVKATNFKPKSRLQAHSTNTHATAKVEGLVIIEGVTDSQNKLVKV